MLESELYDREFDDNAKGGRPAGEVSTGTSIPAAVFQPPQVVFQPPSVQPAPAQPAPAQPTDEGGDGADGGEGLDGADGAGSRRRRRRSGRGRGRADGLADDAADLDQQGPDEQAAAQSGSGSGSGEEPADDGGAGQAATGAQAETRRSRNRSRTRRASAEASADDDATDAAGAADAGSDDSGVAAEDGADGGADPDGEGTEAATGRRRRRKRRRGSADAAESLSADDPPDTVVHVREPSTADDVRSVKGSTRLEAKKQRRREGRETGRRRPPIITESEFLARRESVDRTMVVRQRADRTQIAVLEDGVLVEHYVNRSSHQSYVGNVYLGKVQNVLPSMEAAFVDIGKGRNAVLYAGEVNFDVSGLEGQPKRIESALKAGQSVIVQVTKDPVGHKGARLTSQISLPGRYLVYVPGASMTGISRKLPDTERNRLKQILKKVMPENAGVIVRTAAEGAAEEELSRDVARLAAQWEAIEKKSKTASAPSLLYSEPDLTIRVIRDVFNEDFSRLVVAGDQAWDTVDEYVGYVAPHLAERVSRWQPEMEDPAGSPGEDVFAEYRIDEQLAKALERKVWLPSGGSLVIDKTEAMTVIDVNTGKFTGQGGNLEETVTRNNLEAAEEIVRQLRLRDVGGIVVIDFIDMVLEANRELVLRRLLECLARDRTKHQVAEVTSLGLVQMTRKRVGAGLLEAFSQPCECCNGRGVILTYEPDGDGHPVPHVHSRSADGGAGGNGQGGSGSGSGSGQNGSGGHGSASHGSGGSAGSAGHGSGGHGSGGHGSGNGSTGGNGSGGGRSRTRRGSRGRGGAAASAVASPAEAALAAMAVAGPANVAAQMGLAETQHSDDQPASEPASGELFHASELAGPQADDTQADGERPAGAGRRRRRKPAASAAAAGAPEAPEAHAAPPVPDAAPPVPGDGGQ